VTFLERIRLNISDVGYFGPAFLWRHSQRFTGAHTAQVRLNREDRIHIRAGQSDAAVVRQIFGDQQYRIDVKAVEDRIYRRYEQIQADGKTPVIVDAGANIGAASLWFRRRYPASTIVAIEPDVGNFEVLKMNVGHGGQIIPIQAAIGSIAGFVEVKTTSLGWAIQTVRSGQGTPVMTMDEAFGTVRDGAPFMAKIDIEGFESDLFSSNTGWLSETYVVFIEPHDWMMPGKMTSRTFQRAMGNHDFEIVPTGEVLTYVRSS
jgi:FkbM family methyltransferase